MIDLILERKVSKKSGRDYFALGVDFGYRKQMLTFDVSVICSVLDVTEKTLYDSLQADKPMKIGTIDIKFED